GVRERDSSSARALREQVEVLFLNRAEEFGDPTEFALDLCRGSSPDQVVVARVPRSRTLGEAVSRVGQDEKAARARARQRGYDDSRFQPNDQLLVPAMAWRLQHRFAELEGEERRLAGGKFGGLYLSRALQVVQFRLDKSGADLASEAKVSVGRHPARFLFDGP